MKEPGIFRGKIDDFNVDCFDDYDSDQEIEIIVHRKSEPEPTLMPMPSFGDAMPTRYSKDMPKTPIWFSKKVKSILSDNKIQRSAGNKRSGDLDMKHLYKIKTTDRVFMSKDIMSNKEYSLGLLIDCSGSMRHGGGKKEEMAAKAGYKIIDEFQKVIAMEVMLFNAQVYEFKSVNKILKRHEIPVILKTVNETCSFEKGSYGNHDAYAVGKLWDKIKSRKGKKIMIVLSDGKPHCDNAPDCGKPGCGKNSYQEESLKEIVRKITRQGCPVLSVGINTDYVKKYYEDYEVINDLEELYPSLLNLLQRTIKRRR